MSCAIAPRSTADSRFNSIEAVEDRLVEALVTLEKDNSRVLNRTAFPWIISSLMIAT